MDCYDDLSVKKYLEEREKLNILLLQEETYWKQRAKVFDFKKAMIIPGFFHSSASARKKTNRINFLINNDGVRVQDQEGMCEVVKEYFTTLFTGDVNSVVTSELVGHMNVSEEQNKRLIEGFSFEEFTIVVKQMHPDKASGPDGLNPAFFQNFWAVMCEEVFKYCQTWIHTKTFPGELNCTNVVLIPKKDNAFLRDLRPIALCNVLYKIIAKVLANRLKVVLPYIISENQSVFCETEKYN